MPANASDVRDITDPSLYAEGSDVHLYVTVKDDDENEILELVKSDPDGMFIRDNHEWLKIDPDADNDRVWDRVIFDVTPDAVDIFDKLMDTDGVAFVDKLLKHVIEGE